MEKLKPKEVQMIEFIKIRELIDTLEEEYEKFNRGNKTAGVRARKLCQDVKKSAQKVRVDIQDKVKDPEYRLKHNSGTGLRE